MSPFEKHMNLLAGEILLHSTDEDDQIFFEAEPDELLDPAEILASEWFFSSEPLPE